MLLIRDRDVAQLVACCFWIAEVESSSLSIPTLFYLFYKKISCRPQFHCLLKYLQVQKTKTIYVYTL